jgi:DMSO/TMAO reductase YedYZ molybdopterin-dependent catalytic subunit
MGVNTRNRALSTGGGKLVDTPRIVRVGLILLLVLGVAGIAAPATGRAALQATPEASTGAGDTVEITGLVSNPGALTVADLQALPSETIQHVQETRQGQVEHSFTGVRLYDVLDMIGLVVGHDERNPLLRRYVVITAKDGHQVVISGGEIDPYFGDNQMMLAWEEDGQPLTGDRGPVRLVSPGDERGGRQTDGVIRIEVYGIEDPLA